MEGEGSRRRLRSDFDFEGLGESVAGGISDGERVGC